MILVQLNALIVIQWGLYIYFALKKYNSDFTKAYFDSLKWYREIYMISAEGVEIMDCLIYQPISFLTPNIIYLIT